MQLGLAVHVTQQAAGLGHGRPLGRVDHHATRARHVQQQAAVGDGQARDVVAATLDRDRNVVLAREADGLDHVGDAQGLHDRGGPPIEHRVPDGPRVVVAGRVREEQAAAQARPQGLEWKVRRLERRALGGWCGVCHVGSPNAKSSGEGVDDRLVGIDAGGTDSVVDHYDLCTVGSAAFEHGVGGEPMGAYGQFCPVAKAMELLDERWTMLVIRELLEGSRTFNALKRGVPRISPALLSTRLQTPVPGAGVIERHEPAPASATR